MKERELRLFSALSDLGDDLVLESGAFVPGLAAGGVSGTVKVSKALSAGAVKRPAWFFPATVTACVAAVVTVGILVGVLGQSFGLFPVKPEETTEETSEEITHMIDTKDTDEDTVIEEITEEETEADYVVEEQNYGLPFTVLYCSDTFDKAYDLGLADGGAAVLSEAAYGRMHKAETHLGVKVSAVDGGSGSGYYGTLVSSAMAGKDDYQWILTHGYKSLTSLMTSSYLLDLKAAEDFDGKSGYLSSAENERLTVSGKQLVAYHDFLLPDGYVLRFDRDMVNGMMGDGTLYRLVEEHGWTLEVMASYVTAFGDGSGEKYGLSCAGDLPVAAFVTSSDIRVLDHAGNRITLTAMEDSGRGAAVDSLLYGLSESWALYAYDPGDGHTPIRVGSGDVAFEAVSLRELLQGGGGGFDVGILPYPLYDGAQAEYRTLYVGGYMAVPSTVQHREMVQDVLEVLDYESGTVREAYLAAVWSAGGCTSLRDRAMLDLVADSMTVEQGLVLMDVHTRMEAIVMAIPRHLEGDGAYAVNVPYLWSQVSGKIDDLVRKVGALSST